MKDQNKLIEIYRDLKVSSSIIEKKLKEKGVVEEPDCDNLSKEEVKDICFLTGNQEAQLFLMHQLEDYFKENKIESLIAVTAGELLDMDVK